MTLSQRVDLDADLVLPSIGTIGHQRPFPSSFMIALHETGAESTRYEEITFAIALSAHTKHARGSIWSSRRKLGDRRVGEGRLLPLFNRLTDGLQLAPLGVPAVPDVLSSAVHVRLVVHDGEMRRFGIDPVVQ